MKDNLKKEEKLSYEKPVLIKHGSLKDVTANGSPKSAAPGLGCTRLFD